MKLENVRKAFAKEIRETLRDRRTMLVMLVVPIFLYPALMVIVQQLVLLGRRSLEGAPVAVAVRGGTPEAIGFLERDFLLLHNPVESLPLSRCVAGRGGAAAAHHRPEVGPARVAQIILVLHREGRGRTCFPGKENLSI